MFVYRQSSGEKKHTHTLSTPDVYKAMNGALQRKLNLLMLSS